ncbi:MAG: hypothetical protein E6J90_52370 [Deltaproteobacteria bacterium]|nr:MAG: hypothetical protein E6J90_52370 [Deltaproteobacteria bacterium]
MAPEMAGLRTTRRCATVRLMPASLTTDLQADDLPRALLLADFIRSHGQHYEIVRELGTGASGRAHLAHDLRRRVSVCVKLYHDGVPAKGSDRDWHVTSTLKHPAVADTFTIEEFYSGERDCIAVVSRFIEGHSLKQMLQHLERAPKERQVDISIALLNSIYDDLCDGIIACHEAGFGHGDLHCQNVIVCKRGPKLGAVIIDFDNATIAASSFDEHARFQRDIRSLRRLVGMITQGWKWHEALQHLLDHHQSVSALRHALHWSLEFLLSADRRRGNATIGLQAFVDALYTHHRCLRPQQPEHADAVMDVIELVAADIGLRSELDEAKKSWEKRTRNRFTWFLPPRDPGVLEPLEAPLDEIWPSPNEALAGYHRRA